MHWRINQPEQPQAILILAHGAGAGMDSPFMQSMAEGLCAQQILTIRFEFPYMQQQRETGQKRPPNPQKQLLETWRSTFATVQVQYPDLPILIGGKSMGGRMATLIADELDCAGVIGLGYPFHPPGKLDKLRLQHLADIQTPTLILQGTRDSFARADAIRTFTYSTNVQLIWLTDGDHSFKPLKSSPYSETELLQQAIQHSTQFIRQQVQSYYTSRKA